MADGILARLPALDVDIIGWENDAAISGGIAVSLPAFSLETGDLAQTALTLPPPAMAITGYAGITDIVFSLSVLPTVAITGSPGVYGSVVLELPALTVQSFDENQVALTLPMPFVTAQAYTGITGGVVAHLPSLVAASVAQVPFTANSALSVLPQVNIAGTVGAGASVDVTLRALALAAEGYTGAVGGVAVTLPMFAMSAAGTGPLIGQVSLTLPMLVMQATGFHRDVAPGATADTFVLQTMTSSLTQYDNYPFNSFARFNGVYLGAKDDGIFALSGATDAGVAIDAYARVGKTDMATSKLKRVDKCYVGYKADGDMILRVTTEDSEVRDYRVSATGYNQLHTNVVKLGRGLEARYWQFELRNQNGANFELDTLEMLPIPLRRRLWGKP